jgi:membrane-associated protease RseP (regulator of RpoE activity)
MGTSSSKDWEKLLEGIKPPGLEIAVSPAIATNSDHAAFARAQVPIVFFHSGLHEEYHTEKDTADTINFDGMLGTVRAVAELVKRVDAREERLAWNPDARMGQRQGQGRGVRLGLLPDMNGTGPGVLLQGVATDSPAAKAGLKTGDRVVKIGAAEVKDMESLQAAFGGLRAGQAVEIVVIRNGERLTLSITPAAP